MPNFNFDKVLEAAASCDGFAGDLVLFLQDSSHSETVLRKMGLDGNLRDELVAFVKQKLTDGPASDAPDEREESVAKLRKLILDSVCQVLVECRANNRPPETLSDSEVEKIVRDNLPGQE